MQTAGHFSRCTDNQPLRKLGGPGRVVEIDESLFFKGKYNIGHWERQQQWVFGMVERGSPKMQVVVVPNRNQDTLLNQIVQWVEDNSMIMSDMWAAYNGIANLPNNYIHQAVNHRVSSVS